MPLLQQPLLQYVAPKLQRPLPHCHERDEDEKVKVLAIEDADEKPHEKPNGDDEVVAATGRPPDDKPLLSPAFLVPSVLTPGTQTSVLSYYQNTFSPIHSENLLRFCHIVHPV